MRTLGHHRKDVRGREEEDEPEKEFKRRRTGITLKYLNRSFLPTNKYPSSF